jgi:hypothetical protein
LHTYVIAHRGAPGFQDAVPYVIAVVELEEGPRMMSNVVDVEPTPENLPVDLPLEVTWEDVENEGHDGSTQRVGIPLFRPAQGGGAQ